MCRAVSCTKYNKTTWAGCRNHVDQVMAGIAPANRYSCNPQTTAEAHAALPGGLLGKLFGGR